MKYQLMASYDCGMHYGKVMSADDIAEFGDKCRQLDEDCLRWVIEDENGNQVVEPQYMCRIYKEILLTMEAARMRPFYEEELK